MTTKTETPPEPTVEECLAELRKMFPDFQIIVSIRDCGEETITPRGTTFEYSAQIGMNGQEFDADTLPEMLAQIHVWKENLIEQRSSR